MSHLLSIEPLDAAEAEFVMKRYDEASKEYMRLMNLTLISAGLMPVLVALLFWLSSAEIDRVVQVFIVLFISLLAFFIVVAVIFYFQQVYNKYKDSVAQTKTVESCIILEKRTVAINLTYHFYLDSRVNNSIEVSVEVYDRYAIGDEINIEYTTHDKMYIGYF